MKNRIIFPFFHQNENRQRYIETLELAKEKDAEVVLFTSLPTGAKESEIDNVYHHLLELNGFYQTTHNNWGTNIIKFKRVITRGNMSANLQTYLAKSVEAPMIMAQPNYPKFNQSNLKILLEKLSIPSNLIVE